MARSKLWQRLYDTICRIRVVDSHWHTETERAHNAHGGHDLFSLWAYFRREIMAQTGKDVPELFAQAKTDRQKWQLLKPVIARALNTSYYRHNLVAYQQLFGLKQPELTDRNWAQVNARIKKLSSDPGWYRRVIKSKCRMDMAILNVDPFEPDWEADFSRPSVRFEQILYADRERIGKLEKLTDRSIRSVADLTDALEKALRLHKRRGAVAIKLGHAYGRTLAHERHGKAAVRAAFEKVRRGRRPTPGQNKAYEDFIVFLLADLAGQHDLVVQIHTGVQTTWGHVPDSDPLHLCNLLRDFPRTRFDLFHAGYPYSRHMGILAKHYPNVWADMCWMYVITMAGSRNTLDEWIDLIPAYRILGFGSDVGSPELVYAHLRMAQLCIADVLEKKVSCDLLSESAAVTLAKMMLRDNLVELFKLDRHAKLKKACA